MNNPKRLTTTQRAELVETHNLFLAITRLREGFYDERWKRALFHAAGMAGVSPGELEQLRKALWPSQS